MKDFPDDAPSEEDDLDRTKARPPRPNSAGDPAPSGDPERTRKSGPPSGAGKPEDLGATFARGAGEAGPADSEDGEGSEEGDPQNTVRRKGDAAPRAPVPADDDEVDATYARPSDALKTRASAKRDGGPSRLLRKTGGPRKSRPEGKTQPDDPMIGKILGGCRIEARLGVGGMGTVYRARQLELDREVALKTIKSEFAADTESLKRFQREAKAVGKFRTQHVVQIYQVGNEEGIPYIVLELLLGGNLRELAEKQPEGRLDAATALRYLREAALALADAAEKGLIHRDVKPDNLMLDENGVLKVTDFGISKVVKQEMSMTLTAGGIVGTPMYMSPEQCRGEEIDFRSDMWSLGATFFFLLTGKPPAKGSSLLELIRTKNEVRNLDPEKILADAIPGPLSEVIKKLTMLSRDDRYASYADLQRELDAIAEGRRTPRWMRSVARWSVAIILVGGAGLVAREYWDPIQGFARSTYDGWFGTPKKAPASPRKIDAPVVSPDPTIDLEGIRERIRALDARIQGATSSEELKEITTGAENERPALAKLPADSPAANLVRGELESLESAVASKRADLARRSEVRDRQTRLSELQVAVAAGTDLPTSIRDLDGLISGLPADEYWNDLRTTAEGLLREAKLKDFGARITEVEQKFHADGPKSAETLITQLVARLESESSTEEFEKLRSRARDLDHDVKSGRDLEGDLPGRPAVRAPFEEIAAWILEVEQISGRARQSAKTEILEKWVVSARNRALADVEVTSAVTAELGRVWKECDDARQKNEVPKVLEKNRELGRCVENLAGLKTFDPTTVVSTEARAGLTEWIAQYAKIDDLVREIEAAIEAQRTLGKLAGWLAKRERADIVAKELSQRAEAESVRGDARAESALGRLRNEIRFWSTLTERTELSLQALAQADLSKARGALAMTEPEFASRDLTQVEEIAVLRGVFAELEQAFAKALLELDADGATALFLSARRGLGGLPDGLKSCSAARIYVEQCDAKSRRLAEVSRGLVRVRGGEVEIATGQGPAIDGKHAVAGYFLDPYEFDRAAFKAALDGNALRGISTAELAELKARDWASRPDLPALEVSRAAAMGCLAALGRELPSHAEWWLAAKGKGANGGFPWGENFKDGNIEVRTEALEVKNDAHPLSVGGAEVYHLIGNAAEWVSNEVKQNDGVRGVVVGGGFGYTLKDLSNAARGNVRVVRLQGAIEKSIGFRGVVRPSSVFGPLVPKR